MNKGRRWWRIAAVATLLMAGHSLVAQPLYPASEARKVDAMIVFIDVLDIDDATQTMTLDFAVRMKWQDTTWTQGRRTYNQSDLSEIWYPELQIINGQAIEPQVKLGNVEVFPDGSHLFRQRYFGKISAPIHSQKFPFDKHEFALHCVAINPEPVDFEIDLTVNEPRNKYSIIDWKVDNETFGISTHDRLGRSFPGFVRTFEGHRYVAFYFWKIFVPLTLVVIMSWTVFWVDPKYMEQLTVAVTAMLTIIALQFTLQDLTPDISYLTRLDVYLLSCNILVLLSLIESVMTSNLISSGNRTLALRVDKISRWAFPLAYAIMCFVSMIW